MHKLSSLVVLASLTALLAGCASGSVDEPAAAPAPAMTTASSSPSASPKPSATPSAAPSAAPPATPGAALPAEPTPSTEPAMPDAPAATPASEPEPEPGVTQSIVVTPDPQWGVVRASVAQGCSFTISGSGYEPGQQIFISFGPDRSDYMIDEQSAIADAGGHYSFTMTIAADLPPGAYGVLTFVADYGFGGPDFEATKRFAGIDVVPS